MEKILLATLSALLGFLLSQAFNLVSYLRRPKFRVRHWTDGVLGYYTGDSERPWEIELGFQLENFGINPASNVRIFVSDIHTADRSNSSLQSTSIEFKELKRPIDLIPSGEIVAISLGIIRSDTCDLDLNLQSPSTDDRRGMISADTRRKTQFSARFYVSCDEKNSFQILPVDFYPDKSKWASYLLDDCVDDCLAGIDLPSGKK